MKTNNFHKLEFIMPFRLENGEDALAAPGYNVHTMTITANTAESAVWDMYEWYMDNGFDIDQVEFTLDGKMYECNATLMHFWYAENCLPFDEMMKKMSMVPVKLTAV